VKIARKSHCLRPERHFKYAPKAFDNVRNLQFAAAVSRKPADKETIRVRGTP